jgi:hypothetical protein
LLEGTRGLLDRVGGLLTAVRGLLDSHGGSLHRVEIAAEAAASSRRELAASMEKLGQEFVGSDIQPVDLNDYTHRRELTDRNR